MNDEKIEMKVERFMNLMNEKALSDKCKDELNEILNILFENAELNYKDDLFFDSDSLTEYLKVKEGKRYIARKKELLKEKEVKLKGEKDDIK